MKKKSMLWIFLAGIVVIVDPFWGSIVSNPEYPNIRLSRAIAH
jgi:hypothetical protein